LEVAGVGSDPRVLLEDQDKRAVPIVDGAVDWLAMPRSQYHPTPAERDERVKLDLPPDEAIKLILETGPYPEGEDAEAKEEAEVADWENEGGATESGPQEAPN
jgi:hypothetical protein